MTTTEAESREDRRERARLYRVVKEAERQMPEVARQIGRVFTYHVEVERVECGSFVIERDSLMLRRTIIGKVVALIGTETGRERVLRYSPNGGQENLFHPGRWLIILDQLCLEARQHEEMHLRAERDQLFERFSPVDDAALFPDLPAPAWLGDRDGES